MSSFTERLKGTFKKSGVGGFLVAIMAAILLAWIKPSWGVSESNFSLEKLTGYGVSVIFFFYGLTLSLQKLKAGLADWRMHIIVQLSTFVLFPLLIIAIKPLFGNDAGLLWISIFYLASLPSTVSSSVVMVSVAEGNIPAAIFNASISSLLGIFITPLWMGLFLESANGEFDLSGIILKLVLQVLLPVVLGILLNSRLGAFAEKNRSRLKFFDQSVILLIIYVSFCQSFYNHVFDDLSVMELVLLGAGMIALFLAVFSMMNLVSRWFNLKRENRITVLFCGSKKSLVHGTVMSKVLFAQSAATGMILLPLMLYHALQLILASIIAQRMASRAKE